MLEDIADALVFVGTITLSITLAILALYGIGALVFWVLGLVLGVPV